VTHLDTLPSRADLTLTVLNEIRRKIDEAEDKDIEIRIGRAAKRSNGTSYVSLTPIGVKPGDRIMVVVIAKELMIVSKWGRE